MTNQNIPAFDPLKYKQTTREQWQTAAAAWHRWGPLLSTWLDGVTETSYDMAKLKEGDRVLDLAAGAGGQTFLAAKRVGNSGYVLATDISPNILKYAADDARSAGFRNIEIREMDGEALDVPAGSFDVIISRVGLIYFPDQHRALTSMHRALKPGGRIAHIVYSTAENNKFFSVPVSVIRRRAQLPPPAPGQPGPFSLGGKGTLEEAYRKAGFKDIRIRTIAAPVRTKTAADCLRFEKESFGALHQMLSGLNDAEKAAAWDEIESELNKFQTPSGFEGPCEMIVGVATK